MSHAGAVALLETVATLALLPLVAEILDVGADELELLRDVDGRERGADSRRRNRLKRCARRRQHVDAGEFIDAALKDAKYRRSDV